MLNINTFNNLVALAKNERLGEDARITISGQDARTGDATFNATETNALTRMGERLFRTDADKVSYRNVRAQLLTTLTDLFGVKHEDHLPSAVRAAFVYGETACDRPLTQRRLKTVLTAAAQTLGYADIAEMKHGVEVRHARHLNANFSMPEALQYPGLHQNDMINGKRVSELTTSEKNEIMQAETAKKFDKARDIMLGEDDSNPLDQSGYGSDDSSEISEEDGEYALPEFEGVNAKYTAEDLKQMSATGQELMGYYKTVDDETRVANEIRERRDSGLTLQFEKVLRDPAKAKKAVDVLYGINVLASRQTVANNRLAGLLARIHDAMMSTVRVGKPEQLAKLAKFLAKLGDFNPTDGASLHKLVKAYGHVKYVNDAGGGLNVEEIGDDVEYVDDVYASMMKRIAANIKAFVDDEPLLSPSEKKKLAADMTDFVKKLDPLGSDVAELSCCRYDDLNVLGENDRENLQSALKYLRDAVRANPKFEVNALDDTLDMIAAAAQKGGNVNTFYQDLADMD